MNQSLQKFQPLNAALYQAIADSSSRACAVFGSTQAGQGNVAVALQVAESIAELRELFDKPEVRQRIVALQDSSIGFRTDRDPKVMNKKSQVPNEPYPWEVVRDFGIETSLRGLQLVGNHVNILAGRCYVTKEGFEYLVKRVPGLTDWRPVIGIPKGGTGGAFVDCTATWKLNGVVDEAKATIPVKTDEYSSVEQTIGKATRKFLKRCYEQMSGMTTPEGDVGDAYEAPAPASAPTAPKFSKEDDQIPGAEVLVTTPKVEPKAAPKLPTAPTIAAPIVLEKIATPASERTPEELKEVSEIVGMMRKNFGRTVPPIREKDLCVTIADIAGFSNPETAGPDLIAYAHRFTMPEVRGWIRSWGTLEKLHTQRVTAAR